MQFLPASDLLAEPPVGLEALRFHHRPPSGPHRRLFAVGDLGFCGGLCGETGAETVDPWADVGPVLRTGAVVFGNLETPLAAHLFPEAPPSPFLAASSSAGRLVGGGFSLVNLANNHIADAGPAGIVSTLDALSAVGVEGVGAGSDAESASRLVVTPLGDLAIGWLGCARTLQARPETGPTFWELDPDELLWAVRRHRAEVDVLVISIHWGYMFVDYPAPDHRALTHELVAAGADLVVCHHAHVVQGFETVPGVDGRTAGICHNLGNFLFDWTVGEIDAGFDPEPQRRGVVVVADFDRRGLCRLAALPTRVGDDWIIRWAVGEEGRNHLEHVERISAELKGDYAPMFHRQRAKRNTGLALRAVQRRLRRGDLRVLLEVLPRLRPHHAVMTARWLAGKLGR